MLEVRGDTGEPFLTVSAKPAAALDRVREVLLVRPQAEPLVTAAPDAAATPVSPVAEARTRRCQAGRPISAAARIAPAEAVEESAPQQVVEPAEVEGARDEIRKEIVE